MYLCFDWSSSCGDFFSPQIIHIHFNYFEEKYFAIQAINKCQCACLDTFHGEIAGHFA